MNEKIANKYSGKVLIIAHHFIPFTHSLGGVSRILNLVGFLNSKGIQVSILATKSKFYGYFGYKKIVKNNIIFYRLDVVRAFFAYFKSAKKPGTEHTNAPKFVLISILKKWLKFFFILDINLIMIPFLIIPAINIIKKNNIKLVFISCPPHSFAIIGFILKLIYGEKIIFVLDYRDSWTQSIINSPKSNFLRKVHFQIEKIILNKCDFFIYTTSPMLTKLKYLLNFNLEKKSILMMNGYTHEPSKVKLKAISKGRINIGYFGSANSESSGYRNINLFIELILKNNLKNIFNLHIYGVNSFNFNDFESNNFIFIHACQNHIAALNQMAKMDYLLLLHTDKESADEVMTGKFFDYISAKKPILSFSSRNFLANRYILKYKLGYFIDYRCPDISVMHKLKKNESYAPKNFHLDSFHRNTQFNKMFSRIFI